MFRNYGQGLILRNINLYVLFCKHSSTHNVIDVFDEWHYVPQIFSLSFSLVIFVLKWNWSNYGPGSFQQLKKYSYRKRKIFFLFILNLVNNRSNRIYYDANFTPELVIENFVMVYKWVQFVTDPALRNFVYWVLSTRTHRNGFKILFIAALLSCHLIHEFFYGVYFAVSQYWFEDTHELPDHRSAP